MQCKRKFSENKINVQFVIGPCRYSHLFNKLEAWNKRGGGAKIATLLNVELGINVEGRIFGKN